MESGRQGMSDFSAEDINNAILTGIVKTLEIMRDVKEQGDDLNEVDFDEIIEMRMRDMTDMTIFNETKDTPDNLEDHE
jgi:hypothetical protein|tara:strand:- start:1116 stop:1349 length:234 start_codon:yes stop_codon:yes gene_type:complete